MAAKKRGVTEEQARILGEEKAYKKANPVKFMSSKDRAKQYHASKGQSLINRAMASKGHVSDPARDAAMADFQKRYALAKPPPGPNATPTQRALYAAETKKYGRKPSAAATKPKAPAKKPKTPTVSRFKQSASAAPRPKPKAKTVRKRTSMHGAPRKAASRGAGLSFSKGKN